MQPLAACAQLPDCAFGPRLRTERLEGRERGRQLASGVPALTDPPQPFAEAGGVARFLERPSRFAVESKRGLEVVLRRSGRRSKRASLIAFWNASALAQCDVDEAEVDGSGCKRRVWVQ